jgi:hypothetical protein
MLFDCLATRYPSKPTAAVSIALDAICEGGSADASLLNKAASGGVKIELLKTLSESIGVFCLRESA